jgi:hypothetical protein
VHFGLPGPHCGGPIGAPPGTLTVFEGVAAGAAVLTTTTGAAADFAGAGEGGAGDDGPALDEGGEGLRVVVAAGAGVTGGRDAPVTGVQPPLLAPPDGCQGAGLVVVASGTYASPGSGAPDGAGSGQGSEGRVQGSEVGDGGATMTVVTTVVVTTAGGRGLRVRRDVGDAGLLPPPPAGKEYGHGDTSHGGMVQGSLRQGSLLGPAPPRGEFVGATTVMAVGELPPPPPPTVQGTWFGCWSMGGSRTVIVVVDMMYVYEVTGLGQPKPGTVLVRVER